MCVHLWLGEVGLPSACKHSEYQLNYFGVRHLGKRFALYEMGTINPWPHQVVVRFQ